MEEKEGDQWETTRLLQKKWLQENKSLLLIIAWNNWVVKENFSPDKMKHWYTVRNEQMFIVILILNPTF